MKKNILLIYGGGGAEHEISVVSAEFIKSQVNKDQYNLIDIEIKHDGSWEHDKKEVEISFQGHLRLNQQTTCKVDLVIPCLHGFPGETGDLQSYLEMINVPYIGCSSEASKICFNKISTKLWLENSHIPTTPFICLSAPKQDQLKKVEQFFDKHKSIFIKASSQGSSVGCYPVESKKDIADTIMAAYALSPYVLVEKSVKGRELEVSVFEYGNELHCTLPGEIICPSTFYSYQEKYDNSSLTETHIEAPNLTQKQSEAIRKIAKEAFSVLKLRHLARIDFFLTDDGDIYINEVNTFPGMTPISMFPKMMENYGIRFDDFFARIIKASLALN